MGISPYSFASRPSLMGGQACLCVWSCPAIGAVYGVCTDSAFLTLAVNAKGEECTITATETVTTEDGMTAGCGISGMIALGDYRVKEISAPPGYSLDTS